MKKNLFIVLLAVLSFYSSFAQEEFIGNWEGTLSVQVTKMRLVFQIKEIDGIYKAKMGIPDQGTKDIPISEVIIGNNKIVMLIPKASIEYTGFFNNEGQITGTFTQAGQSFPLDLSRRLIIEEKKRPQEPTRPYPYKDEEVTFRNEEVGITLSGTLTLPLDDKIHPAVILIMKWTSKS